MATPKTSSPSFSTQHQLPQLIPARRKTDPADTRLRSVNQAIEQLAERKPYGDIYAAFSLAAHLATEAIQVATELRGLHRADASQFDQVIEFWHRTRDYNLTAAMAARGGNQTLPEALVTRQLLRKAGGE